MDIAQKIVSRNSVKVNDRKEFEEDVKRDLQDIEMTLHAILYHLEFLSKKIIQITEGKGVTYQDN